jgi:hypothetical protein
MEPLDPRLGTEPSLLHYFARPGEDDVDPDYVRWLTQQRQQSGGHKGELSRQAAAEKRRKEDEEEERMRRLFGQA